MRFLNRLPGDHRRAGKDEMGKSPMSIGPCGNRTLAPCSIGRLAAAAHRGPAIQQTMNDTTALLETLTKSDLYRDYERAYSDATGLPLALRGTQAWQPPFRGKARENAFCSLMAAKSASCAACLRMQERIANEAADSTAIAKCHFRLAEAAVPLKLGQQTIGFLT